MSGKNCVPMTCRCRKRELTFGLARFTRASGKSFTCYYDDDGTAGEAHIYIGKPISGDHHLVPLRGLSECSDEQLHAYYRKNPKHRDYPVSKWRIAHDQKCPISASTTTCRGVR